jgi:acyl carrier protein
MRKLELHIRSLLAEVSGVHPSSIRGRAPLLDYGLDSLRTIDLIVRIEDDFGIHIAEDALFELNTVSDVAAYVRARRST